MCTPQASKQAIYDATMLWSKPETDTLTKRMCNPPIKVKNKQSAK